MKKRIVTSIVIGMLLGFLAVTATQAQTIHNMKNAVIGWDPVDIPAEVTNAVMKYQVSWKVDMVSITPGTPIGTPITATQFSLSFTPYQQYYIGVQAQLFIGDSETPSDSSSVSWSYDPAVCSTEGAFGFLYKPGLGPLRNMRKM